MATDEINEVEKLPAEESEPVSDRRSSSLRFGKYALVVAGTAMLLAPSVYYFASLRKPETQEQITEVAQKIDPFQIIKSADDLLLNARLADAMETYKQAHQSGTSLPSSFFYRVGLCAEALQSYPEALHNFNIASQGSDPETEIAAELGIARVNYRNGELSKSSQLLSSLAAKSATPQYTSSLAGRDVDYMMGLVRTHLWMQEEERDLRDRAHILSSTIEPEMAHLLQLVPREGNQIVHVPVGDDVRFGVELHGKSRTPRSTLLSVGYPNQPGIGLIDLLSSATGWKFQPSEPAVEVLSAKRINVHLRDKTAAELLWLVLEPVGLSWSFENDTVVIDRPEAFDRMSLKQLLQQRTRDLLLNAITESPSHKLAPYAYLALGNLSMIEGRFDAAATFYNELGEKHENHEMHYLASYNLAKLSLIRNQKKEASRGFYRVVDMGPSASLIALSYMFLGRISMEQNDLAEAKKEFSRCLVSARDPDVEATAAATLASAYLLDDEPGSAEAANAILMDHREPLGREDYLTRAIFLSSLTRFRTAIRPSEIQRRRRELTSAVMRVEPETFFGDFGFLLVADAFREIGVHSEVHRICQQGLSKRLTPAVRDELLFRMAESYKEEGQAMLAQNALLELAAGGSTVWKPAALIELAHLLFDNSEYASCVRHCHWALENDFSENETALLLRILGRAYESIGDHRNASECFAGFLPPEAELMARELK